MGLKDKFRKDGVSKQQWLDWLSDDSPGAAVQAELRQQRLEQARRTQYQGPRTSPPTTKPAPATPPPAGVSIQINLPDFRKPQFSRSKAAYQQAMQWLQPRFTRKRAIIIGAIAGIIIVPLVGASIAQHANHKKAIAEQGSSKAQTAGGGADAAGAKPDFTPVIPSGKDNLATPDNIHARYDVDKQSYSFLDTLNGKQLTVSQQRLASADEAAQDAIKAAKGLQTSNVTSHQIKTGWGAVAVVTNQKYNFESLVFSIQDKLVFIQTSEIVNDSDLITYVNSLN